MKLNVRITVAMCIGLTVVIAVQFIELTYQYNDAMSPPVPPQTVVVKEISPVAPEIKAPKPKGVRIFPDDREVRRIAFLKIHKAASGTATSIFFRFGMSRGLTFVLAKYINSISSIESVNDKGIYPRMNKSFDIMTSHVIYNKKAFQTYMPADTVYIGILREPYLQFKSTMNYMAPQYVYNISKVDPIQQYLRNPLKYERNKSPRYSWINNRQSAEFGVADDIIIKRNQTGLDEYIKQLDEDFRLVIIAEHFDESIILMRRMLNWKLQDVLYRRLHIRGWDRKLTLPRPGDRKLYRKYAFSDYALYDFFFKRLWRQVSEAGADFFAEVLHFKQVREEVDDFCKVYPNITGTYDIPHSDWNSDLLVDKEFCGMIFAEEEDWIKEIGLKQYNITPKPI